MVFEDLASILENFIPIYNKDYGVWLSCTLVMDLTKVLNKSYVHFFLLHRKMRQIRSHIRCFGAVMPTPLNLSSASD